MTSHFDPLVPRCGHCHRMTSLFRCESCEVQPYCSPEHQVADYPSHERVRSDVLRYFGYWQHVKEKLHGQYMRLSESSSVEPSTDGFRIFVSTPHPHGYSDLRYAYIEHLARIKTYDSVVLQLGHVFDSLRLWRYDCEQFSDLAPHLLLRLDMDQDAYNFIKIWQITATRPDYDWGGDRPGCLSTIKNIDCFEGVNYFCGEIKWLSHIVATILVKVKMLSDLISLQQLMNDMSVPLSVPAEIFSRIREYVVRSPIIKARKDIMESKDQQDRINMLVRQVVMLYKAIDKANVNFWPTLLEAGPELGPRILQPECKRGDILEARHVIRFVHDAWMETSGATEIILGMTNIET